MNFNEKLKKYREDNNLTQEDLANILHVSRQAISKYETGRAYPSIEILQEIALLLDISVDELLSKKEITKETIETKHKINKNKFILIGLLILVVIGIIISLVAMSEAKTNKEVKDDIEDETEDNIVLCGIVGVPCERLDELSEFNTEDFLNRKYFGYITFYDQRLTYRTPMNINYVVATSTKDYLECEANVYLSRKTKYVRYFSVYYDLVEGIYSSEILNTYSGILSQSIEVVEYNNVKHICKYTYIFFDELVEMKISEFDSAGNLIRENIMEDQTKYTIDNDTLYVVVEEKLIDLNGEYYYNREIIFNEEINRHYSYLIKKANVGLIANKYIGLEK